MKMKALIEFKNVDDDMSENEFEGMLLAVFEVAWNTIHPQTKRPEKKVGTPTVVNVQVKKISE